MQGKPVRKWRCMRDVAPNVGKLKKKLVRAEKNGGAGK
jgi:hypothetical protein